MIILGSTETILPYSISYAKYILFAAPFMAKAIACIIAINENTIPVAADALVPS